MATKRMAWWAGAAILMAFGTAMADQPVAKMLPGNCLLYVEVKDVKALQENFKKTALYGLYSDPSMKEVVTGTEKKVTEAIDKWLKDAWKSEGIENPPETLPRPEGRVVLAVRLDVKAKQVPKMEWSEEANEMKANGTREVKEIEPQVFIMADMGSHAEAAKDLIKQLVEKAVAKGSTRKTETIRSLEVQILTPAAKDAKDKDAESEESSDAAKSPLTAPMPQTTVWAWQGTTLLLASDVAFFKDVATRMDASDQDSLADEKDFQKILNQLQGDTADVWVYVSAKSALTAIKAKVNESADEVVQGPGGSTPDKSQQTDKIIQSLGVDGLTGIGLAVAVAPNDMEDARVRFMVGLDGPPRGIVEIFAPAAMSTKPTALITKDVASFFVANCDLAKVYDKLIAIATEVSGQPIEESIKGTLKQLAGEGNEPIDLRKDLMEQITGPATMLVTANKPYDSMDAERFTFALGLRDGAAVDKTIGKLVAAVTVSAPTEMKKSIMQEMNGVNLYVFPANMMGGQGGGAKNPPAIAVVGQNLFIGPLDSVQRAIRDKAKEPDPADSIASDPMYEYASKLLPAQAAAFSYGNQQIAAEIQWTVLKKAAQEAKNDSSGGSHAGRSSMNPMVQMVEAVKEYVDFSALPEFGPVKKYFGCEVGYVTTSEDGIFGEYHHVKAPPVAASEPAK